jgi:hypothetical protein
LLFREVEMDRDLALLVAAIVVTILFAFWAGLTHCQ